MTTTTEIFPTATARHLFARSMHVPRLVARLAAAVAVAFSVAASVAGCATPASSMPAPATATIDAVAPPLPVPGHVPAASAASAPRVRVAILRTATRPVREAMLFSGGRIGTIATVAFSAFLVEHGDERFLFDTGLGRRIDAQYDVDMPRWMRPFFGYDRPVDPAADQLSRAGEPPVTRIVLSHAHWDHASALGDFPGAQVALAAEELETVRAGPGGAGAPWPSQVGDPSLRWSALTLPAVPFEGFDRRLDLFGDGTAVLVAMPGHTPGSLGLFLRLSSGRRLFLVGDVVWHAGALAEGAPKFAPARWLVDADAAGTQDAIARVRDAQRRDPGLVVVPAHDGQVQAALGWFPRWVE